MPDHPSHETLHGNRAGDDGVWTTGNCLVDFALADTLGKDDQGGCCSAELVSREATPKLHGD